MPQQSLFGGWPITDLRINVHLQPSPLVGGRIEVEVLSSDGKRTERQTLVWRKDRDVSDLGMVLKAVAEAFLWGEQGAVSSVVALGARAWLPEVPSGQ